MDINRITSVYPVVMIKNLKGKTSNNDTRGKGQKKEKDFEKTLKITRERKKQE